MSYSNAVLGANFQVFEKDPTTGYVVFGSTLGTPSTDASQYAPGAIVIDRSSNLAYQNRGTSAAPKWFALGQNFQTCTVTNGTSAVNIFSSAGAPVAMKITGILIVARDTTAGNITVQQAANTVTTLAKGTSTGVAVGGGTLANVTYAAGDVATVLSSSAGNADVFITWQLV